MIKNCNLNDKNLLKIHIQMCTNQSCLQIIFFIGQLDPTFGMLVWCPFLLAPSVKWCIHASANKPGQSGACHKWFVCVLSEVTRSYITMVVLLLQYHNCWHARIIIAIDQSHFCNGETLSRKTTGEKNAIRLNVVNIVKWSILTKQCFLKPKQIFLLP